MSVFDGTQPTLTHVPPSAAFDHGDAGAEVRRSNGGGEPRGATPYDQEVKPAAASRDHRRRLGSRLGHWPPPGALVVSGRIVAPNPVSRVRCAAICAGLTCRGS